MDPSWRIVLMISHPADIVDINQDVSLLQASRWDSLKNRTNPTHLLPVYDGFPLIKEKRLKKIWISTRKYHYLYIHICVYRCWTP